ncbi:MAG: energy transducer TonB [Nitrospirae bacterium]|nr:energy transducer TonB [Nitrospirota bacterium]
MTTATFDHGSTGAVSDQTRGWLTSVLVHGLGIAAALFAMGAIEQPTPPSLFQWDIAMVESSVHPEAQLAEPIVQPPPPPVKSSPPVRQTKQRVAEPPPQVHQDVTVATQAAQVVKDVVTNAEPVMEYAAVAATESEPVVSPSVVETPVESSEQPVTDVREPVESVASRTEYRQVAYRQVLHRETRADFGWLRDTLWNRIEELKRYPALARMNHWEGKVVVSAVIRDDGEVMGVQIAETSGRAVLDEEAMAVMKKASPLRLKHPLGQRQITILIPISYRLDG